VDEEKRFTELYDENHRRVLAYALANVVRDVAEDVASETFLIAWRRLDDVPDPPLPWLIGVARNLLRQQRSGGDRRRALAERIAALTTPEDLAAWDVAEHVIERDSALAAVAALSERDLEVLALVMWHGLAPREAPAFFVRLHRARRRLARAFDHAPSPARTPSPAGVRTRESLEKS
jgi:DNA-directed RNA polymerase specialized sigma24 family protein